MLAVQKDPLPTAEGGERLVGGAQAMGWKGLFI